MGVFASLDQGFMFSNFVRKKINPGFEDGHGDESPYLHRKVSKFNFDYKSAFESIKYFKHKNMKTNG